MFKNKWLLIIILLITISCACPGKTKPVTSPSLTPAPPTQETIIFPSSTPEPTSTPTNTPSPVVYIPSACKNHPVATLDPAEILLLPTVVQPAEKALDQVDQLTILDELVKKINEIYLYPDFNGVDWQTLVNKEKNKIQTGLDTPVFYKNMQSLVYALGDEHSSYLSPLEVDAYMALYSGKNDYVGIGVVIHPVPEKNLATILNIFPGSSAEHSGIKLHDSILAIDGVPLADNKDLYLENLRGPECSAVTVTVQSPGGKPRDLTIMRYRVKTTEPVLTRLLDTRDGSRIGYIYLPSFFDKNIPAQVKKALMDWGTLDGLILDNRNNQGGASTVVDPVLGYFTSGTVGHFVSRKKSTAVEIKADPIRNSQNVPLVVLASPNTVSYGEIFNGILQDSGRAKVVGTNSAGNVEILHSYDFLDGSRLWIAQERFEPLHNKNGWEKIGVTPDVEAYADWETYTFEDDPSINAAVKLLGHE